MPVTSWPAAKKCKLCQTVPKVSEHYANEMYHTQAMIKCLKCGTEVVKDPLDFPQCILGQDGWEAARCAFIDAMRSSVRVWNQLNKEEQDGQE